MIGIIGGSVAAVIAGGAWLRWTVRPVTAAYRLGRAMGLRTGASDRQVLTRAFAEIAWKLERQRGEPEPGLRVVGDE